MLVSNSENNDVPNQGYKSCRLFRADLITTAHLPAIIYLRHSIDSFEVIPRHFHSSITTTAAEPPPAAAAAAAELLLFFSWSLHPTPLSFFILPSLPWADRRRKTRCGRMMISSDWSSSTRRALHSGTRVARRMSRPGSDWPTTAQMRVYLLIDTLPIKGWLAWALYCEVFMKYLCILI